METIVTKLSWAGVRVDAGGEQLLIDALEGKNGEVQSRLGAVQRPLVDVGTSGIGVALLTHTHKDHYDADLLRRRLAPEATVLVPAESAGEVREAGFNARGVNPYEKVKLGAFQVTALPSVDGFGAPQVAWLLEAPGAKLLHFGDTLFHGFWWQIAKMAGQVDAAFFPINGARIAIPGIPPTGLPGVLTAEQAAVAARLLQPKLAVPMHYQEFNRPPVYNPDPNAETTFLEHIAREGIKAQVFVPGDVVHAGQG